VSDGLSSRRSARERALGLLYEAEAKGVPVGDVVDALPLEPDPYAVDIARGVGTHLAELDSTIGRYSRDWPVERMPAVDRAVLRMATYELAHRPDVPTAVILNEAVELAKGYSTDDSGRFVNGVLARIAEDVRAGAG
jgi:N utilization substance protein B